MSAAPELKLENHLYCIHGRPITKPCLECEEFIREHYPERAPSEHGTIQ